MLGAPVAMALNFKFGAWRLLLAGTVLTVLGFGLAGLAQNIGTLFLTYGTILPLGLMLMISHPVYLIGQIYPYKHPRHSLTTSVGLCGFPIGELD